MLKTMLQKSAHAACRENKVDSKKTKLITNTPGAKIAVFFNSFFRAVLLFDFFVDSHRRAFLASYSTYFCVGQQKKKCSKNMVKGTAVLGHINWLMDVDNETLNLSRNPVQCSLQVGRVSVKQMEKFQHLGVASTSDGVQDKELYVQSGKASAVIFASFMLKWKL